MKKKAEAHAFGHATLQSALDGLPHGVAVVGNDGKITAANEAAGRIFAMRAGDDVAKCGQAWASAVYDACSTHKINVEPGGLEDAIRMEVGGDERFFLPRGFVKGEGEKMVVIVVAVDVTDYRKRDAEQMELLTTVSHDLKSPLTSLQMAVHLLMEDGEGKFSAKEMELLRTAADDTERMRKMIADVLDAGRAKLSGKA